jgi:signal transduction histidine kinase
MRDANLTKPTVFGLLRGLSGKVLALTILFVMLGEVLIFLPSIANFRIQFMKSRIAQAEIAALAAEAAPDQILTPDLRTEILKGAGVTAVSLEKAQSRRLMLRSAENTEVEASYDLRPGMYFMTIGDAFATLFRSGDRIISVVDYPPNMSGDLIEVAMHEKPLHDAMLRYGLNILLLSVILSLIVASLIFAALNRTLVKPIRNLSANMVAFGDEPEDRSRVIVPSARGDEIGMAEQELHSMQTQLQSMLQQKDHLAALGLAVSKVSHDLRNMLTTAQLVSDRLADVRDPTVQRFAPKLFTSLDRAINFLNETIKYGKAQDPPPRRERFKLIETVDDVCEQATMLANQVAIINNMVKSEITIDADREQLHRILTNLVRNAVQAFASERGEQASQGLITISAIRHAAATSIRVDDNGPGIPPAVRSKLFEAFQSADRQGGVGLGLAISAELVRAHQGTLEMVGTGNHGTSFVISIPDIATASNVVTLTRQLRDTTQKTS